MADGPNDDAEGSHDLAAIGKNGRELDEDHFGRT